MNESKYGIRASGSQSPDYDGPWIINKGTGTAIPKDEPIFILRAKDLHSTRALRAYEVSCIGKASSSHVNGVREVIRRFLSWQANNQDKVRVPD